MSKRTEAWCLLVKDKLSPGDLDAESREALIALALRVLAVKHYKGRTYKSPHDFRHYLQLKMGEYSCEVFGCLFLNSQHQVLANRELFKGTVNAASVYPRDVARVALELGATAVALYHNHPSGSTTPSHADITITRRLRQALEVFDVRVLDHFVVSSTGSVSLAERGDI